MTDDILVVYVCVLTEFCFFGILASFLSWNIQSEILKQLRDLQMLGIASKGLKTLWC